MDKQCPLSYFVRGMPRMVNRGYGCKVTGARCAPCDKCEDRINEASEADDG
jgi:hypothetical protein